MNFKEKWGALCALVGIPSAAAATTPLTEANLEQLNAKVQEQADALATANNLVATLTNERDTATETIKAKETELRTSAESLKTAQESLTASTTKVGELEKEVARLGKQPGAFGTTVVNPNAQDENTPPTPNPVVDPKAAHNQLADSYFK